MVVTKPTERTPETRGPRLWFSQGPLPELNFTVQGLKLFRQFSPGLRLARMPGEVRDCNMQSTATGTTPKTSQILHVTQY
jgi:hypothetical protein